MIRLPPTTIVLDRTDLNWHGKRSDDRIKVHSYNERQRFADSESLRRELIPFEVTHPSSSDDSLESDTLRRDRRSDSIPWEEVLVHRRRDPSTIATSPVLPPLRTHGSSWSETDSSSSSPVYTPSEDRSEEDEDTVRVPCVGSRHNQSNEDTSSNSNFNAARVRFDGNYEDQDEEDDADDEMSIGSRLHTTLNDGLNAILVSQEAPTPVPARLRAASRTTSHFASPLRITEAAHASSSPRRSDNLASNELQSSLDRTQPEQHIASPHRSNTMRSSPANHTSRDVVADRHLELFSPASERDLQMFRNGLYRDEPASQAIDQAPQRFTNDGTTARTAGPLTSHQHSLPTSTDEGSQGALTESDEESSGFRDIIGGLHDGSTPYIPNPSLRVYDDEWPRSLQPQTPVGLRRNGITSTSMNGPFTAPARRPRRVPVDQLRQLVGSIGGTPVYVRRLEGYEQQENLSGSDTTWQSEEGRRQLLALMRRDWSNDLETTPPS